MLALHRSTPLPYGTWWIDRGTVIMLPSNVAENPFNDLDLPYRTFKLLCVKHSNSGCHLKWDVERVSGPSMDLICEVIEELRPPFRLEFFINGWTSERYEDWQSARRRIFSLRGAPEPAETRTVFRQKRDLRDRDNMGRLIRRALDDPDSAIADHQYFYEYHGGSNEFILRDAGEHCGLSELMGEKWIQEALGRSDTPNQDDQYDRAVVPPYYDVWSSGNTHHDFIIASVMMPDGEAVWCPYQRLIQPLEVNSRPIGVKVTSQAVPSIVPFGMTGDKY